MTDRRHGPVPLAIAIDSASAGDAADDAVIAEDGLRPDDDQPRLVRAIESAIEVADHEQFQAWLRGPFAVALPHEAAICLELGKAGDARLVACVPHRPIDADTMNGLRHADHGLGVRLAHACRHAAQPSALGAASLRTLLPPGDAIAHEFARNALVHHVRLLTGGDYAVVLINVPGDEVDRCLRLFKLLSSHLKMALARAVPRRRRHAASELTARELEILKWMAAGKSNREISALLAINPITLKNHIAKVYRKLDVQSRDEAVARGRIHLDYAP